MQGNAEKRKCPIFGKSDVLITYAYLERDVILKHSIGFVRYTSTLLTLNIHVVGFVALESNTARQAKDFATSVMPST